MSTQDEAGASPSQGAAGPMAGAPPAADLAPLELKSVSTKEELTSYGFDIGEFADAESLDKALITMVTQFMSYGIIPTLSLIHI